MARIHFLLCNLGESWDDFVSSYLEIRYDRKLETFYFVTQVLIQAPGGGCGTAGGEPQLILGQSRLVLQNSFSRVEFDKVIKSTNKEENWFWKLQWIGFAVALDSLFGNGNAWIVFGGFGLSTYLCTHYSEGKRQYNLGIKTDPPAKYPIRTPCNVACTTPSRYPPPMYRGKRIRVEVWLAV